ncbi:putative stress-related vesicular transport protein [Scheffersomyces coipomensis]|uniref:putative stress-related vesicular transport protein n=1 Tax=Scheffersomyces coipomensis TaxID=1788519 RepID=UPI00315C7F05
MDRDELSLPEEILSTTSSSSSFVPVDQIQDAIQIIDENKQFNQEILSYIKKTTKTVGNDYHIISVFGSQSTGKSTLLNRLFNTNFDVMEESRRQQTTKGIWLASSPIISNSKSSTKQQQVDEGDSILVMDVEGTDGRERGEDQDFERKAALFAMATSEILILNIWETQIGLYQGANLGLLKTVFEVNISLFGKSKLEKTNDHKVLLLIVIRDHIGTTPKENLADIIVQDLNQIWDTLNIPTELSHLKFNDFFDIDFHALRHKVLQPKEFMEDIYELGNEFKGLFKPNYHHNIPIDGWTLYAENCWNQINNNKDLDLPTQQILVAKFKCDEIISTIFDEFLVKFNELPNLINGDYENFGLLLIDLRDDILENYKSLASKYNKSVFEQKELTLKDKLNGKFKEIFDTQVKLLLETNINKFKSTMIEYSGSKTFYNQTLTLQKGISQDFNQQIKHISLNDDLSYDHHVEEFNTQINNLIQKQQVLELQNILNKSLKKLNNGLNKYLQFELNDPKADLWDNVLSKFNQINEELFTNYTSSEGKIDFGLGTTDQINKDSIAKFKFKSWVKFYEINHKLISKTNLLTLLKDRFDDKFRYDENGLPKLYIDAHELEVQFDKSKSFSLDILPILSLATLKDGSEILPEFDIFNKTLRIKYLGKEQVEQDDDDEEDDDEDKCFAENITEQEKSEILTKFKKEIDAKFIETKRSIVQHITQIPYYIYLIIVALGWNEFMAILRNPLLFSLLIIIVAGVYILYQLNLLRPALIVVQRLIDEVINVTKEKLREVLIDDYQPSGRRLERISKNKLEFENKNDNDDDDDQGETIELQDLKSST